VLVLGCSDGVCTKTEDCGLVGVTVAELIYITHRKTRRTVPLQLPSAARDTFQDSASGKGDRQRASHPTPTPVDKPTRQQDSTNPMNVAEEKDSQHGCTPTPVEAHHVPKETPLAPSLPPLGYQVKSSEWGLMRSHRAPPAGTTTATVLARAILNEGCKSVAAGMNPMDLRRGINMAVDHVLTVGDGG